MARSPRKRKQIIDQAAAGGTNGVVPPAAVPPPATGRTRADQIVSKEIEWIVPDWFAVGEVTLLAGTSTVGKSTLMAALAAQVTGGPSLLGTHLDPPKSVLWYTAEERISVQVEPRLRAAGARLGWVVFPAHDLLGKITDRLYLPSQLEKLRRVVMEEQARLVVLDPITSWLDESVSMGGDVAVRQIIEGLLDVAWSCECHIIFTRHDRKGRAGPSIERVGGSGAWTQTPRTVVRLEPDPMKKGRYLMIAEKGQVAGAPPTRYYTLPKVDGVPRCVIGTTTALVSEDLVDEPVSKIEKNSVQEAEEMIRYALDGGERSSEMMWLAAQKEGISIASMKRALARLKPTMSRKPHESSWKMYWSKPEGGWPDTRGAD